MDHEDVKQQMKRLTKELTAMVDLVREVYDDEVNTEKRYNLGVIVGIEYAHEELKKIIKDCGAAPGRKGDDTAS